MSARPYRLRTWTDEQEALVLEMMKRGKGAVSIAKALRETGCSAGTTRVEHKIQALKSRNADLHEPTVLIPRRCLKCKTMFPSAWIGNRICIPCQTANADEPPMAAAMSL